jgi:hypothetical protein
VPLGNGEHPDRQPTAAPPGFDPKNEPIVIDTDDGTESVTSWTSTVLTQGIHPLAATEYVEDVQVLQGK